VLFVHWLTDFGPFDVPLVGAWFERLLTGLAVLWSVIEYVCIAGIAVTVLTLHV